MLHLIKNVILALAFISGVSLGAEPSLNYGVHPGPRLGCPLCAMDAQLENLSNSSVLYSVVSYPEENGVRILRTFVDPVYGPIPSPVTPLIANSQWAMYSRSAMMANAVEIRRQLSALLGDGKRDEGKAVYFKDYTDSGISPAALGLNDASCVTDSLTAAAENRQKLSTQQDFTNLRVYLGFPRNEQDHAVIFKGENPNTLAEWQGHYATFKKLAREIGARVSSTAVFNLLDKAMFLRSLEGSENIVLVVCHGENATFTLPGKEPFTVSVDDIKNLKLDKHPFVFLRICESRLGDNIAFAKAFNAAGAVGTCVNTGEISAADATSEVFTFLREFKKTGSISAALEVLHKDEAVRLHSKLYTLLRTFFSGAAI